MLASSNIEPDSFTKFLLTEMHKFESCEPCIFYETLQPVLQHHRLCVLRLDGQLHRAHATILEPTGMSDTTLKFTAGLTTAVSLVATVDNVKNTQNVCVQVSQEPVKQTIALCWYTVTSP